jgi:subfamily B ATP-binding cassette protein HlyB/CyaB
LAVEKTFEKKWESKMANYVTASYKTRFLGNITNSLAELIQSLLNLLIIWTGTREVLKGNLSVGQFIAFRMYSSHIIMPIIRTLQLWQTFQQTGVAVNNLEDIFDNKPEMDFDKTKTVLPPLRGAVEFENVNFKYKFDGKEILKDVSFKIEAGSSLGIIGRSGSGKSTISKLIQKLYHTNRGKVIIDGVDTTLVDPSWIRRQIGVVLQDNYLFNDTIKNNIDIANAGYSDEQIKWAASLAGAHEFIEKLPEGYNTIVGEKGAFLSGGQRQRIAIARALVSNPRILIFDEATSALDYESESIIQKNMKEIVKGRTVIIIAHRMSTLRDVNHILSLDKGEVIEFGKKENLLKNNGLYSYMCSQQMG